MVDIKTCPMCGSNRIRLVKRDVHRVLLGKYPYTARNIEFHECPKCGEKFYGPEAMDKMDSFRPKLPRRAAKRKAS